LGFILAGVTTPAPPSHLQVYQDWLSEGYYGEMAYLASERAQAMRSDPLKIMPECQSILILGIPYSAPPSEAAGKRGRLAAYAWGDDYHEVLPGRIKDLLAFIEDQLGGATPNRWYTDTGPLLERELAQRAGLGWIGKNTCLINPKRGSYFLLAELLLGVALTPDKPFSADRCGSCTRCIAACPTACILPNRTIDARRCISYLTIELKGSIPSELRTRLEGWVFGCDICQQVCPWNLRFSQAEGDPAFAPRPGILTPELPGELFLDTQAFNRKFKGSAVQRARRRGYLRNLATVTGNAYAGSGDPDAVTALQEILLHEFEPLVRSHAAWALGQVGGMASRLALARAALTEMDPGVLHEIQRAQGD